MNARERIMAALRGEPSDGVPWTIYEGLLPRGQAERELRNRGLGLVVMRRIYQIERPNVRVEVKEAWHEGYRFVCRTYHTPLGSVSERLQLGHAYGTWWIKEFMAKDVSDYGVLRFIIEDGVIHKDYGAFLQAGDELGGDGVVIAQIGESPLQTLQKEIMGMEQLSLWMYDHPRELEGLLTALEEKQKEIFQIAAESPAELVHSDENITATMTSPRAFERYCLPFYERHVPGLHQAGKLYLTHFDGLTRSLRNLIAKTPIDVIEAFTPPPMGDLPVREAKEAWKDKVIWSNFPGCVFLWKDEEIRDYTVELLREASPGGRFILGCTEDIDRWKRGWALVAEGIAEYESS